MPIRFLIDQNVDNAIADFLTERGHEVFLTRDVLSPNAPDQLLMFSADVEGLVVVTHDQDFAKLRALLPVGYRARIERGAGRISLKLREHQAIHRVRAEIAAIEFHHAEAFRQGNRFLMTITQTGVMVTTNAPRR